MEERISHAFSASSTHNDFNHLATLLGERLRLEVSAAVSLLTKHLLGRPSRLWLWIEACVPKHLSLHVIHMATASGVKEDDVVVDLLGAATN